MKEETQAELISLYTAELAYMNSLKEKIPMDEQVSEKNTILKTQEDRLSIMKDMLNIISDLEGLDLMV